MTAICKIVVASRCVFGYDGSETSIRGRDWWLMTGGSWPLCGSSRIHDYIEAEYLDQELLVLLFHRGTLLASVRMVLDDVGLELSEEILSNGTKDTEAWSEDEFDPYYTHLILYGDMMESLDGYPLTQVTLPLEDLRSAIAEMAQETLVITSGSWRLHIRKLDRPTSDYDDERRLSRPLPALPDIF
jgi:hypothetical protein